MKPARIRRCLRRPPHGPQEFHMPHGRSCRAPLFAVALARRLRRGALARRRAVPPGRAVRDRHRPARPLRPDRRNAPARLRQGAGHRDARRERSFSSAAARARPRSTLTKDFAELLEDVARRYDIVTVDQRGTGESGAVSCELPTRDATACANALGERRAYYNTPETAHDLEDLRIALGVDKLTLLGVSYGAKVASEYARRYPAQTAAVVLDSPAPVDGLDGYDQLRTLGTPRVLREVCFPGLCHATVRDPEAALAAAAERLRDGAVRGPLVDRSGRVKAGIVRERDLYSAARRQRSRPVPARRPAGGDRLAGRRRRRPAAAPRRGGRLRRGRRRANQHRAAAGHVLHRGPAAVGAGLAGREPRGRARRVRRRARRELRAVQRRRP